MLLPGEKNRLIRQTEDQTSVIDLLADERETDQSIDVCKYSLHILIGPNINTVPRLCSLTVKQGKPSSPQITA